MAAGNGVCARDRTTPGFEARSVDARPEVRECDPRRTVIRASPVRTYTVDPFSLDDASDGSDVQEVLTRTPPETLRAFVFVSVLVQVGLLAGSLGLMLAAFRGQWSLGTGLAGVGVAAFALAVVYYRRYRAARGRSAG